MGEKMSTYRVFKRSCTNWKEFGSAEKKEVDTGLTYDEAREACREFRDNRSEADKEAGTLLEFEKE